MPKELVIVESPAKARTLDKILGKKYEVLASMGHVRDLPQYRFGVNVAKDFTPSYEVPKDKKELVKRMAETAKKASSVYLATDPDREGEAISWHLLQASKIKDVPIKRVVFHEITDKAIKEAFKHPRDVDLDLVNAQQARRVLDRVVGYRLSPLLWRKIEKGLSAGRVQSVALRMVADREEEIQSFVPTEYWTIEGLFNKRAQGSHAKFKAMLTGYKGSRKKLTIPIQKESDQIVADLDGAGYSVEKVQKKDGRRQPAPPFTTSTLQQEAWRKLRFSSKRTMTIAQQLYEGLPIGSEGQVGLITYMRTDSTNVSMDARREVREFIGRKYGAQFVPPSPRVFGRKSKGAQEAHEAIRPTRVAREPAVTKGYLTPEQQRLYELIWKRMVASQMANAVVASTSVSIDAASSVSNNQYIFKATGSVITFPGFLVLYSEDADEKSSKDGQGPLPELSAGDELNCHKLEPSQHFTQPPPRYTEATLIKALEENGVGRPSTYAPILSTIQDRKYVKKEKGKFFPTDLGSTVNSLLKEHFSDIVDLRFTAEMEEELDEVARGERGWVPVVRDFYEPFQEMITKANEAIPDEAAGMVCDQCERPMVVRAGRRGRFIACSGYPECKNTKPLPGSEKETEELEEINDICNKCGKPMTLKMGRLGKFIACTGYPECKNTKPLPGSEKETEELEEIDDICNKCGKPMTLKIGRLGKFIACTGYPKCKNTKPYLIKTGVNCPDCAGDLVEKTSKKGRTFYGCANYPTCNFAVNQKPQPRPCPNCGGLVVASGSDSVRCIKCKDRRKLEEIKEVEEAVAV